MRINVYPRVLLEQMWQEDKKLFTPNAENPPLCLRCGQPLHSRLIVNALSRHADAHICEDCGTDEALRDAYGLVLPLQEWYALKKERKVEVLQDDPALTTTCNFGQIFDGPKKLFPYNALEYPVSELAYSRSDYDGRKWWSGVFPTVSCRVATAATSCSAPRCPGSSSVSCLSGITILPQNGNKGQ